MRFEVRSIERRCRRVGIVRSIVSTVPVCMPVSVVRACPLRTLTPPTGKRPVQYGRRCPEHLRRLRPVGQSCCKFQFRPFPVVVVRSGNRKDVPNGQRRKPVPFDSSREIVSPVGRYRKLPNTFPFHRSKVPETSRSFSLFSECSPFSINEVPPVGNYCQGRCTS
jgi:hypothetical protein